jgi:uncharacterized C2H2 Zn-finger protein
MPTTTQPVVYNCQSCLYITDNKKDYSRHLGTRKHQQSNENNIVITDNHTCDICNKIFKSRTSIYKHRSVCRGPPTPSLSAQTSSEPDPASLTLEQIKQLMIENRILKELLKNTAPSVPL